MTDKSLLERYFSELVAENGLPVPLRDYRFALSLRRRWELDFAWLEPKIGVEVQGGIYMRRGGHNTPFGITRDCEKGNIAQLMGWLILHVTEGHIYQGQALAWLKQAFELRGQK